MTAPTDEQMKAPREIDSGTMTSRTNVTITTGDQRVEYADLIARLEKATGPDRMLDGDIWLALVYSKERQRDWKSPPQSPIREWASRQAPEYTKSIDDAVTIIEPRSAWAVSYSPDEDPEGYPKPYRATVMPDLAYSGRRDATDWHDRYPAIALCIAALKARAAYPQSIAAHTGGMNQ